MAKKWKLGDRVTSPARLRRRVAGDRKTWEAEVFLGPVTGILVGTRVLQNGRKIWLGPDEGWGWKQEGTVRAALIATHLHRAPVLVPLDTLTHELEPSGAVQPECILLDHPAGWTTTCGLFLRTVDLDAPCPKCGQALRMENP